MGFRPRFKTPLSQARDRLLAYIYRPLLVFQPRTRFLIGCSVLVLLTTLLLLTLAIPIRKAYHLEDFITMRHLENMGKVVLATGLIVTYSYLSEGFFAWYSGDQFEQYMELDRIFGRYGYMYWILIIGNILTPQL